jgi:hypothetical protein
MLGTLTCIRVAIWEAIRVEIWLAKPHNTILTSQLQPAYVAGYRTRMIRVGYVITSTVLGLHACETYTYLSTTYLVSSRIRMCEIRQGRPGMFLKSVEARTLAC